MRMSYQRQKEVLEMPNLIEVQKDSYQWFLDEGLNEVFDDISPIADYGGKLSLEFIGFTFDEKEAEWYERTQNIISALNAGVDSLVLKKGEVEQKKEEWEEILRREEEENAGFFL